jgi:hypothetical protein
MVHFQVFMITSQFCRELPVVSAEKTHPPSTCVLVLRPLPPLPGKSSNTTEKPRLYKGCTNLDFMGICPAAPRELRIFPGKIGVFKHLQYKFVKIARETV